EFSHSHVPPKSAGLHVGARTTCSGKTKGAAIAAPSDANSAAQRRNRREPRYRLDGFDARQVPRTLEAPCCTERGAARPPMSVAGAVRVDTVRISVGSLYGLRSHRPC